MAYILEKIGNTYNRNTKSKKDFGTWYQKWDSSMDDVFG